MEEGPLDWISRMGLIVFTSFIASSVLPWRHGESSH